MSIFARTSGRGRVDNPDTVMPRPDFMVTDFGDEVVLFPKTDRACEWIADRMPHDIETRGAGVVVTQSSARRVVFAIRMMGLSIHL